MNPPIKKTSHQVARCCVFLLGVGLMVLVSARSTHAATSTMYSFSPGPDGPNGAKTCTIEVPEDTYTEFTAFDILSGEFSALDVADSGGAPTPQFRTFIEFYYPSSTLLYRAYGATSSGSFTSSTAVYATGTNFFAPGYRVRFGHEQLPGTVVATLQSLNRDDGPCSNAEWVDADLVVSGSSVVIDSFSLLMPTATTSRDFASYGTEWIGDAFSGRLRFVLTDETAGIDYDAQDVLMSFEARDASSSPTWLFKNVPLDVGHEYHVVASLSRLIGDQFYELVNTSTTFSITAEGLELPGGDVVDTFSGTGEAGSIIGALRTRLPFVYMFDLFSLLQRLGAVSAETWEGLTLDFGTIAGVALSVQFFSEAQIREYIPDIFFTLIRGLIIAGYWLGFLAYAWKRVSHPSVENK